jgi:hypothetical protein
MTLPKNNNMPAKNKLYLFNFMLQRFNPAGSISDKSGRRLKKECPRFHGEGCVDVTSIELREKTIRISPLACM